MKFAHLADCHIGGWKEQKLKELGLRSFELAIDTAIKERVGFILISGDLFDTALPSIDLVKDTARILYKVKEFDIPIYIIPGSHDFSPSGKTMLDVYEEAGLVENVCKLNDNKLKFTTDRTGIKITGMLGRKGSLEIEDYKKLDRFSIEKEAGFKIFMFHSLLDELKPANLGMIEGLPMDFLPRNFNYYAGGHPHLVYGKNHNSYGFIAYPGPMFPNNFAELEDLKYGSLYINEVTSGVLTPRHYKLKIVDTLNYAIGADNKKPEDVQQEILETVKDFNGKIVTIRVAGKLNSGKPSEIDFKKINEELKDAYIVLRNTSKLESREFELMDVKIEDVSKVEEAMIKEAINANNIVFSEELIFKLMNALDKEKLEGERTADFEIRVLNEALGVLNLGKEMS
jgi:DNA repair protein SbcD/Mre11